MVATLSRKQSWANKRDQRPHLHSGWNLKVMHFFFPLWLSSFQVQFLLSKFAFKFEVQLSYSNFTFKCSCSTFTFHINFPFFISPPTFTFHFYYHLLTINFHFPSTPSFCLKWITLSISIISKKRKRNTHTLSLRS